MSWPATTRYELDVAPGSLAFVQDFLNTIAAGSPKGIDLLVDATSAQAWLDDACSRWVRERVLEEVAVTVGPADLLPLRALRSDLVDLIRAGAPRTSEAGLCGAAASVRLEVDGMGQVRCIPRGAGWWYVASIVLIEVRDAQLGDGWRRLKSCANERCSVTFFDRSRNNSRTWHDGAACGNRANLRAYRARKRAVAPT